MHAATRSEQGGQDFQFGVHRAVNRAAERSGCQRSPLRALRCCEGHPITFRSRVADGDTPSKSNWRVSSLNSRIL